MWTVWWTAARWPVRVIETAATVSIHTTLCCCCRLFGFPFLFYFFSPFFLYLLSFLYTACFLALCDESPRWEQIIILSTSICIGAPSPQSLWPQENGRKKITTLFFHVGNWDSSLSEKRGWKCAPWQLCPEQWVKKWQRGLQETKRKKKKKEYLVRERFEVQAVSHRACMHGNTFSPHHFWPQRLHWKHWRFLHPQFLLLFTCTQTVQFLPSPRRQVRLQLSHSLMNMKASTRSPIKMYGWIVFPTFCPLRGKWEPIVATKPQEAQTGAQMTAKRQDCDEMRRDWVKVSKKKSSKHSRPCLIDTMLKKKNLPKTHHHLETCNSSFLLQIHPAVCPLVHLKGGALLRSAWKQIEETFDHVRKPFTCSRLKNR